MKKELTTAAGAPVVDNQNIQTAGPRGPALLQDVWFLEKLAHFDREVIPERRMHAKGAGAHGAFTVTHDITRYTKARIFSAVGKKTDMFARFSVVAGERGAADAERDIRSFALKFYTEEGNWDLVGNNTPVFFHRDPLKFPDLNHAIKRDPRTGMRNANNNWDFWTSLPEALHQVTIMERKADGTISRRCRLRQCKYLNNIVEQDHRNVKRRTWLARGYGSLPTAWRTLRGIEAMEMVRKGQAKGNVVGQLKFINSLFGIAA